ncbi:protein of unknown function [Pseudodesulfovibrio profundus]|uniref:Uncharacterized protein n=1 Tax=Pseudodesulfovibrio profundus TaxID=57320 RepID=A0A2C8FCC7_9BACT|nr:protein of unknown function [Pseudodesulfovibrio profundus]
MNFMIEVESAWGTDISPKGCLRDDEFESKSMEMDLDTV